MPYEARMTEPRSIRAMPTAGSNPVRPLQVKRLGGARAAAEERRYPLAVIVGNLTSAYSFEGGFRSRRVGTCSGEA